MDQPTASGKPSNRPIVFMAHICYGSGLRYSARQFENFGLKNDGDYQPGRYITGFSLLAHAFNDAWCFALNKQEEGWNIPYFVMLHDDIEPEDWWVNTLIEDLEKSGADMCSALVPLKDQKGATSTAIDHDHSKGFDRFRWERRITMAEAEKLPEVFTAADADYPDRLLLANTGCWICRFDRPWRHSEDPSGNLKVFFQINNRIHRHPNTGKWVADCEPEDWFFSRQLQNEGGKIAITRRVRLKHWGMIGFPNYVVWGEKKYDEAFGHNAGYTPIGEQRPDGDFTYESTELADVPGWLNDSEGRLLAKYAAGKRVLEVGSYKGRSTIWMARVAESIFCVDKWDGSCTPTPGDTLPDFLANVKRHAVIDKITTGGGTLAQVKKAQTSHPTLGDFVNPEFGQFDFIFIDGDHSEEGVKSDIEEALSLLAEDGVMAFHDYGRPTDPGVKKMVDALLLETGSELLEKTGTVAVIKVKHGGRDESGSAVESPGAAYSGTGPEDCGPVSATIANGHRSSFIAVCSAVGPQ